MVSISSSYNSVLYPQVVVCVHNLSTMTTQACPQGYPQAGGSSHPGSRSLEVNHRALSLLPTQ